LLLIDIDRVGVKVRVGLEKLFYKTIKKEFKIHFTFLEDVSKSAWLSKVEKNKKTFVFQN